MAKIMLIDDDHATNYYHSIIIEEMGLKNEVVICEEVDEAIAVLRSDSEPPDIIFLDINMPKKTGWDFLDEYQNLQQSDKAKYVVILSTTQLPGDIERANKHNLVHKYFTKPLTSEMVSGLLMHL